MDYANIILEMLDRIKRLEKEMGEMKQVFDHYLDGATKSIIAEEPIFESRNDTIQSSNKRDTTRYMFEGKVYLKNRLVLAVVRSYVSSHPYITRAELKKVFEKSLQGSIGVVENVEIAKQRNEYSVRFFTKPEEVLELDDGDMYVCTQWGILNIPNFIKRAEQLGYTIEPIL